MVLSARALAQVQPIGLAGETAAAVARALLAEAGESSAKALAELRDLVRGAAQTPPSPKRLVITERAVAKHIASIFLKLNLQPSAGLTSQDLIIRCLRTMAGCGTRGADLERR